MLEASLAPILPLPWQAATQQRVFRQLLNTFAYPGRIETLDVTDRHAERDKTEALLFVLAVLLDGAVTLADPDGLVGEDDWRRLEVRREPPECAHFVVARGAAVPAFNPTIGSLENPEHGATVILAVERIGEGGSLWLSGPGIAEERVELRVAGLDPAWLAKRERWNAGFPMGIDLVLVDAARVAALPRTTRIQLAGEH